MKKGILFVDDHESILLGFRYAATSFFKDYRVFFAMDGTEALQIMEETEIDVIVSDMTMPKMDGAELLEIISKCFPKTFRIIHSASFDQDEVSRASKYCHKFLEKPCDLEILRETISSAFSERFERIEACSHH